MQSFGMNSVGTLPFADRLCVRAHFLLLVVGFGSMLYNLNAAVSNFEYVLSYSLLVFVVHRTGADDACPRPRSAASAPISCSIRFPSPPCRSSPGKYLALLVLYLIPLAIISVYPLIFARVGEVYLPTSYGSIFAFFLLGAALLSGGDVPLLADREPGSGGGVGALP